MKHLDIFFDDFRGSDFDKNYIIKIVNNALNRYFGAIKTVEIRLKDTNGPKGGVDKLVTLRIVENSNKEHVIKSKGTNILQATYSACRRAKSAVGRHLDKMKIYRKQSEY